MFETNVVVAVVCAVPASVHTVPFQICEESIAVLAVYVVPEVLSPASDQRTAISLDEALGLALSFTQATGEVCAEVAQFIVVAADQDVPFQTLYASFAPPEVVVFVE